MKTVTSIATLLLSTVFAGCVATNSEGLDACQSALEEVVSVAPIERPGFLRERCAEVAPENCRTAEFSECSDWLCALPDSPAPLCALEHRSTGDTGLLLARYLWTSDRVRVPRNFDELVDEVSRRGPEARARAIHSWRESQGGALSEAARIRLAVGIAIAMSLDVPILEISRPR